jgi:hypothetical protein
MNLISGRGGAVRLSTLREWSVKPWFYPAILLLLGIVSYGYAWKALGYFWDDWEVVFLLNAGNPALLSGYFAFDRPFAWPYQLMYMIFGLNPVAWHAVTFLLRFAAILLLYYSLRAVWPRLESYLRWLGALLLVYPGYLQQSISAAYNRHFMAFFLFALSIFLMVLAIRKPGKGWFLWPLSWALSFIQAFTIEYFVGLDLIRPFLLWMLVTSDNESRGMRAAGKALLLSFPYLLILGFYFWWRLIVFPTTISVANYAGDVKLLDDFHISFGAGLLAVLTRALLDLIYSTLQVWMSAASGSAPFTLQSKIAWFAIGAGAALSILFVLFNEANTSTETRHGPGLRSFFFFGLWAFLVSGLPIWLTSKQLNGGGRWDDRFTLAPMLGASTLTLVLIMALVRHAYRRLLLALLLALAVVTQVLTVNKYRLDWSVQNSYYWQLAWRIPGLLPQTAILSWEQPSASIPGYDASFAYNILFDGKAPGGSVPYWFFTNDRFLNFDLKPGKAISYKDRNLRFSGNTSDAIAIVHQGENRCLQVLDAVYAGEPSYSDGPAELLGLSNVSRILPGPRSTPPPADVFGAEPSHTWCWYFEKADLARQQHDWDAILVLDQQARRAGFAPSFGPEYVPFIEAYANRGNWRKALDLSRAAQGMVAGMNPVLCLTWERLGKLSSTDTGVVGEASQAFACPTP